MRDGLLLKEFILTAVGIWMFATGAVTAQVLYVSNQGDGTIDKVANGTVSTFVSNLDYPTGMAFDGSGNLYVASYSDNTISKITPNGHVSLFASAGGINHPEGLAFDSSGNLYCANLYAGADANNYSIGTISKITHSGTVSTFAMGIDTGTGSSFSGLAFDSSNGNLYASSPYSNVIDAITSTGVVSVFASFGAETQGLVFDSHNNLFAADYSDIYEITPGGSVSTFASGLEGLQGLALDGAGDAFATDFADNMVVEVSHTGTVSTFASGLNNPQYLVVQVPEPSALIAPLILCALGRFGCRTTKRGPSL
jgi:hypothetical protein